jgi:hypothetical protein
LSQALPHVQLAKESVEGKGRNKFWQIIRARVARELKNRGVIKRAEQKRLPVLKFRMTFGGTMG